MLRSERGLSVNTLNSYRLDLDKLSFFLRGEGSKDAVSLARRDVPGLLAFVHRQGLSPASLARSLAAWRGFYRFLLSEGEIRESPFINLATPKATARLPKALSLAQVQRLL